MGGFGKNNFYGNNNKGGRRIPFVLVIERYIFSVVFLEYNIYYAIRRVNEMKYFVCISYVRSSGEVFISFELARPCVAVLKLRKRLGENILFHLLLNIWFNVIRETFR